MEISKLIINGIIYLIVTLFFIWLIINEQNIGEKIKEYRDKFSNKIIDKLSIVNEMQKKIIRKTVDWVETIGSAVILVLIIQYFYIGNFLVPTGSMIPTILPGDRLFGNMVVYKFFKPARGDILVFKEPLEDKNLYTKRLIGLPGDKVKIGEDNRVYINGVKLEGDKYKTEIIENGKKILKERDYFRGGGIIDNEVTVPKKGDSYEWNEKEEKFLLNGKDETMEIYDIIRDDYLIAKLRKGEKIILEEDYYFVLGDNSANSKDSRYWGFVAEHRIKGKPLIRFWPLNRIGFLE